MTKSIKVPINWDDLDYLNKNPDVANYVSMGRLKDGYTHYFYFGIGENRIGGWQDSKNDKLTRMCMDPWNYIEITPDFGIKPCCKIPPLGNIKQGGSIADIRNEGGFLELRRQLFEGNLNTHCKTCHIRAMVPTGSLEKAVKATGRSVLNPQPLKNIRIELTTRCNLRCVYCAVSQPSYKGKDLETANFKTILSTIAESDQNVQVHINGHGETTYHPDWLLFCKPLLAMGRNVSIITNLSRPLTDEEAYYLAQFKLIEISLDTVDPELLPKLRRKVHLHTIIDNFNKIQAFVKAPFNPSFSISCGVYDQSINGIPQLCQFAIDMKIDSITFWQMVKYNDIPGALNVYPIDSLDDARVRDAVEIMDCSVQKLKSSGVTFEIAGDFVNNWRKRCN